MAGEPETILLVEDNPDDIFLMRRALRKAGILNPLQIARDGQQALDYLAGHGNYGNRADFPEPSFVFIDLKLPYISGWDVLKSIRVRSVSLRAFVLTSSNQSADIRRASELGADAFLVKPPTPDQLLNLADRFGFRWHITAPTETQQSR